ncbi:MAG: hypothetical protein CMJ64_11530 [Planctomycetaceae bacterium]|nr:hypothetical protein [Planctomycetaceae bacterium]
MNRLPLFLAPILFASTISFAADEETFSGPQVDEKLAPFKLRGVLGDAAGKEIDIVSEADGKPIAIFFVHEVTRPSVGLTRLIMNYAAKRAEDGLHSGVVFLSDDPTDTENWMKRASHALPKDVVVGVSVDGQEGPGAYGLNRNVAVTVLVGKGNKVTANYALVQPSIQADAPRIAKSIVDVLGGDKVPTLAQLGARGYDKPTARVSDPKLDSLLRQMIQKTAKPEQVKKAADDIESYVADKKPLQERIGSITKRIIAADKLQNYGTQAAQEQLKAWAKKYGTKRERR